ncbi:MAG: ACP S-malonyltransferase, partial [Actinobacteria bacterium]|nr:ACP S-malonyltransferase [Actinomycetota bacterium]
GLATAVDAARAAGVRKILALNVGGAFHTPLMDEARQALAPVLAELSLDAGSAPVVSNGDGMPYADGEGWRSRLADHLVQPVRWRTCLETIAGLGVSSLIEVGPGAALAGMAKRTVPHVPVRNVSTPADAGVTVEV